MEWSDWLNGGALRRQCVVRCQLGNWSVESTNTAASHVQCAATTTTPLLRQRSVEPRQAGEETAGEAVMHFNGERTTRRVVTGCSKHSHTYCFQLSLTIMRTGILVHFIINMLH